jgi:hypothetical protein
MILRFEQPAIRKVKILLQKDVILKNLVKVVEFFLFYEE